MLPIAEELNLPLICHMAALMRTTMTHNGFWDGEQSLCEMDYTILMDSFLMEWNAAVSLCPCFTHATPEMREVKIYNDRQID